MASRLLKFNTMQHNKQRRNLSQHQNTENVRRRLYKNAKNETQGSFLTVFIELQRKILIIFRLNLETVIIVKVMSVVSLFPIHRQVG